LSYGPAKLYKLAESIPGLLKSLKYRLCSSKKPSKNLHIAILRFDGIRSHALVCAPFLNYIKDQNYELRCVQVEIVDIITLERRTRVREGGGGVGAAARLGFVVAGERTPRATAGEAASPAEVGF
jgi:hypothetical protein